MVEAIPAVEDIRTKARWRGFRMEHAWNHGRSNWGAGEAPVVGRARCPAWMGSLT